VTVSKEVLHRLKDLRRELRASEKGKQQEVERLIKWCMKNASLDFLIDWWSTDTTEVHDDEYLERWRSFILTVVNESFNGEITFRDMTRRPFAFYLDGQYGSYEIKAIKYNDSVRLIVHEE
jgi:hypothetical protein